MHPNQTIGIPLTLLEGFYDASEVKDEVTQKIRLHMSSCLIKAK